MAASKLMSREELLQLAALDAFGLLDEIESEQYTRSFHDASAAVQDEILRLQAELASDETMLPDVTPSTDLRRRVLSAVADAIERESVELAPIASIGGARRARSDYEDRFQLRASGYFWRAAAFVLASAVVVLAYLGADAFQKGYRIAELALDRQTDSQLKELIGADFADFINNPNCVARVLRPVDHDDFPGTATVYINEKTNQAFVLGMGIPQSDEPYTIELAHADGTVEEVYEFVSNGVITSLRLDRLAAALLTTATWRISSSDGTVILQTA